MLPAGVVKNLFKGVPECIDINVDLRVKVKPDILGRHAVVLGLEMEEPLQVLRGEIGDAIGLQFVDLLLRDFLAEGIVFLRLELLLGGLDGLQGDLLGLCLDIVNAKILEIDKDRRRISLSIKETLDPEEEAAEYAAREAAKKAAEEKPPVQVNEKLEVIPQITINVPDGSDVTVNVDSDVVRNMSESRKIDIIVNKVSEKDMKMDVILNTQQKGIIQTYDPGINDTPVTLPISAYRCVMRPINWFDFIRLVAPSSQNRSDDELKKWSVIYKHLKNPSIGTFNDFDDFLKKTKYQDRELLMWAVLVATADEEEPLSITCPNPKCRYQRTLKYRPRTIVHLDPDHIPAHYDAVHNAQVQDEAQKIFNEVSNKRTRYTLPSTGIIVEISEPSAYDFITKKLNLVQDLYKRYVPDGDMSELDPEDPKMVEFDYLSANALYITSMSIVRDGKEYMFDQWEDIEEIIRNALDTEDSAILLKIISKSRANTSPVSFYLEDIVCPKCGLKREKLQINDIGQTLLFQVSRRLDNMEINLKEMD